MSTLYTKQPNIFENMSMIEQTNAEFGVILTKTCLQGRV